MNTNPVLTDCGTPKQRIMQTAERLFYLEGIRGVGVERIAKEAKTTKMALYRHFASKDELVACWLSQVAENYDTSWQSLEAQYRGKPREMLMAFTSQVAATLGENQPRGCPLTNSLVELPDPSHPARAVIAAYKAKQVSRIERLCNELALPDAKQKALLLHMVYEGAQITVAQGLDHKSVAQTLHSVVDKLLSA